MCDECGEEAAMSQLQTLGFVEKINGEWKITKEGNQECELIKTDFDRHMRLDYLADYLKNLNYNTKDELMR